MLKRSSIGKHRSKALPAFGFAGMSLAMASGACASASEASANTSPSSQKHEIFLGEEEISDVSLATFYVFDKEDAGPPPLFQKLRLAFGGCGCGCSCSPCAYWPQPPQPPKATQPTQHRKKKPPHRKCLLHRGISAFDPKRTSAVHCHNDFDASVSPYQYAFKLIRCLA